MVYELWIKLQMCVFLPLKGLSSLSQYHSLNNAFSPFYLICYFYDMLNFLYIHLAYFLLIHRCFAFFGYNK